MMKKSLIALAVLGTVSGFAMAESNVTVYGAVDAGVTASKMKQGGDAKFQMSNGNWYDNQVGIKGQEDLGKNNKVFFRLEQGFKLSNGQVNDGPDNGSFNRESVLGVGGDWGSVSFGRFGGLSSDTGSYSILGGSAYGTSFQTIGNLNSAFILAPRVNNAIALTSPKYDGTQFFAVYSNGVKNDDEKWADNSHYYGLGGTFSDGNFKANAIWEMYDNKDTNAKNSNIFTLGASYDFGSFTLYGAYQYAMHSQALPGDNSSLKALHKDNGDFRKGANQNAVSLSISTPISGGTAYLQGQYAFGKLKNKTTLQADVEDKYDVWSIGAGYTYPVSKRTLVYAGAAYGDAGKALKSRASRDFDLSGWNATVGMAHTF